MTRMIPMMEFFDRLITGATVGTRSCNNEIEDERYQKIKAVIEEDAAKSNLDNAYWHQRKEMDPKFFKNFGIDEINGW